MQWVRSRERDHFKNHTHFRREAEGMIAGVTLLHVDQQVVNNYTVMIVCRFKTSIKSCFNVLCYCFKKQCLAALANVCSRHHSAVTL